MYNSKNISHFHLFVSNTTHAKCFALVSEDINITCKDYSIDSIHHKNTFTQTPSVWYIVFTHITYTPRPVWLIRGYTGHEHLPEFALINMNGRLYDPVPGRMLSPDNFVQDATSTQAYNRYAYARNNPLKYKDPSGEWAGWDEVIVGAIGFTYGYVSYGLKTGKWGWKAVGSGVLNAGIFLLGYYTGGAGTASYGSIASGFSAAQGYANTVALSYAGQMVATSAVSSFFPAINIPIGSNLSISVSPALAFSPSGFSAGMNIGATYSTGDWSISAGFGANQAGYRISGGASYYDRPNNQYFSFYASSYGGGSENNSFFWQAGWAKNGRHILINEDFPKSDQYRTFAIEFGTRNFSIGSVLYTTTHSGRKGDGAGVQYNTSRLWRGENQYKKGSRIYSGLYFGYKDGNTINRVGIDAPFVGDFIQGGWHAALNIPLFDNLYGPGSTRPYIYRGTYDPFSLYGL